ncbi:MAG: GNAT family N-acetyltransferase [Kiritimatiellaeota bacterium]|nr:GNAT family N-acetyltransferase [Kiritimatiellota bacterium]
MARFTPQLNMVREDLRELPPVALPAGCRVRSFGPGDDLNWTRIIAASFNARPEQYDFERIMRGDAAFRPQRIFFIDHAGTTAATASAWHKPGNWGEAGVIHYVGVLPDHRGLRLGYWVTLRAMHHISAEGRDRVVLETDDFRLPAIKTYLNLGFVPLVRHESHPERWRKVLADLGLPELAARFGL